MKLDAINIAFGTFHCGYDVAGRGGLAKSGRQFDNVVAMAHPDIEFKRQFIEEQRFAAQHFQFGMAVFAAFGGFGAAAEI
ncbi:hypothetical protein OFO99_30325, partial [Escherichia coli]|nr:hypothetical protein [Escherichia coli]